MSGEDDASTRSRAAVGDRHAFRAIVAMHQHVVHAVLSQMLFRASIDDVEDLAQETFLRVHRALHRFEDRGSGSLKKWIVTIAARVAIDHLRKAVPAYEPFDEAMHGSTTIGADALARFRRVEQRVEQVLVGLSHEQRSVLVLRELHGLEYQEIASALGLDIGTVKSRLHRARSKLQQTLNEDKDG